MNSSTRPSDSARRLDVTTAKGAWIAAAVILAWLFAGATIWWHWSELSWWVRIFAMPLMSFLYTGLFITAHDAMHGLIVPGAASANRRWGKLALAMYAGFSFDQLNREHHRHHARPASEEDPDYHGRALGDDLPFWSWWGRFMWTYRSWRPFVFYTALAVLNLVAGGEWSAYVMIWAVPSLLSTLQLFYFGTYRPHRHADVLDREQGERVRARSDDFPTWLSFITCYHFGYHEEHHRRPDVPWWALPQARRAQQALQRELA